MAKSNPVSVRFDLEKVEFVKTAENLKTSQNVVDFLLDKYWWERKSLVVAAEAPKFEPIKKTGVTKEKEEKPKKEADTGANNAYLQRRMNLKNGIK